MPYMDINLMGQAFSDCLLLNVGSAAFELEHDWFTKQDLVIRTAAGGAGTLLVEGTDYTLSIESEELSDRVTAAVGSARNVFHMVTISNATYQTGNLYFSGKYIADSNCADDTVPTGAILPYGGTIAPAGWLLCDGTPVSRWTYRRLFAVIGTAFGVGDGSTTFNVPNMKGVSPTGVGAQDVDGRTKTGPALGEAREDAFQGHSHSSWSRTSGSVRLTDIAASSGYSRVSEYTNKNGDIGKPIEEGSYGPPRIEEYTHGPEIGVNFIVKT
jgi:microcystin-dependent protein